MTGATYSWLRCLGLSVILGCASVVHAQDPAMSSVENAVRQADEATEGVFPSGYMIEFGDTEDWIRLTSGEWLRGDLKWMRDKDFEFDSDKLDLIRKAWNKVDQLHSPRVKTYVFNNKVYAVGRGMVTADKVIVETEAGVKTFPRGELVSILEGGRRELDWWSLRLGAGFSATSGNSNQGSLNVSFGLSRDDQQTSAGVGYEGTFGYVDRKENVSRHIGAGWIKVYISQRFYVIPLAAEIFNDKFANIRFRATPAALGGVHLFDTGKVEWDVEFGLGYQFTSFLSAAAGVENPQDDGFVPVRTYWDFDITGDIELILDWQSNIVYTQFGNTNHVGKAVFSVEVTDILNFDAAFDFFRTERPVPREDGTVPRKNDYQIVVGISLRLG